MTTPIRRLVQRLTAFAKARRLVIGVAQGRVSATVVEGWRQPRITERWEVSVDAARLDEEGAAPRLYAEALQRLLAQAPQDKLGPMPCTVILADQWVRWISLPWLDAAVSPLERDALARARLADLYGDIGGWLCVAGPLRYGQAQLSAAIPQAWMAALRAVLSQHRLSLRSCQPAHAMAFNHWRGWDRQESEGRREQNPSPYLLFATADDQSLTLSWIGQPQQSSHPAVTGIRSIRLDAVGDLPFKQIQREILLQQLHDPLVCLVMFTKPGGGYEPPRNWRVLDASDAGRLPVASSLGQLLLPAPPGQRHSKASMRRQSRTIGIDFARHRARSRVSPRWLLFAGIASVLMAGAAFGQLDAERAALQEGLQNQSVIAARQAQVPVLTDLKKAELAGAQKIVASLNRPWGRMFLAIETSTNPDVTLLELSPDAQAGDLHLSGDARSFKAILAFVQALKEQGEATHELRDVYLSSHQVNAQDPQRTIHFEVNAQWQPQDAVAVDDGLPDTQGAAP